MSADTENPAREILNLLGRIDQRIARIESEIGPRAASDDDLTSDERDDFERLVGELQYVRRGDLRTALAKMRSLLISSGMRHRYSGAERSLFATLSVAWTQVEAIRALRVSATQHAWIMIALLAAILWRVW